MSKLALKIAKRIMTMDRPKAKQADRIELKRCAEDGMEYDLGGRNIDSVVRAIDEVLSE